MSNTPYQILRNAETRLRGKTGGSINAALGDPLSFNLFDSSIPCRELNRYRDGHGIPSAVEAARSLFQRLGITGNDNNLCNDNCVLGLGTTQLYRKAVKHIASSCKDTDSPVFLVTAPTYGLFSTTPKFHGMEVQFIPLFAEHDWKLDPEIFKVTIRGLKALGKTPICLYCNNPHNPSGSVTEEERIDRLSDIVISENLFVIDDLVYSGLEYEGRKATPFASKPSLFNQTLSLFSLSKTYASPELRSGAACGPSWLIEKIARDIQIDHVSVPSPTQKAFETIAGSFNKIQSGIQTSHIEYQNRAKLAKALVNGFRYSLSESEEAQYIEILQQENISQSHIEMFKKYGIPYVNILNPNFESGYFLLIDFSELQGQYYGTKQIQSSIDLNEIFIDQYSFLLLPSEVMLMHDLYPLAMRMTIALPPESIIRVFDGIMSVIENLSDIPDRNLLKLPPITD